MNSNSHREIEPTLAAFSLWGGAISKWPASEISKRLGSGPVVLKLLNLLKPAAALSDPLGRASLAVEPPHTGTHPILDRCSRPSAENWAGGGQG